MKLASLLLFCCFINITAGSYSQEFSFKTKNTPVKEILAQMEANSNYKFLYRTDVIDVSREVSLDVSKSDIFGVLACMFDNHDISYKVFEDNIVVITNKADLQQQSVSGVVTDATSGEPLAGVNILIEGTLKGVVTDVDGKFSIQISDPNAVLVFSYIGYNTETITVGNQSEINVQMIPNIQSLEEIVVVGYGLVKKETLTGSVASISADDITTTKSENLISNIQGKVSGLMVRQLTGEPGKFNNYVSIRGYGAPLVVIDGVVRDGTADMAQLNSNDIESISILKDASAAIYGLNAANGVILITTKKGNDGKARFTYSNLLGFKSPTGLENTVDAYTYRKIKNEMDRNSGVPPTYTDEILENYRQGLPGYRDVNWIDLTLKDRAFAQNHNFSVRGGNERVQYYNSFAYTEDNGLLTSEIQKYRRFNLRSTTSAKLNENLKLNVSVSGRLDNSQSPREPFLWNFKTIMVNDRGVNYHTIANEDHYTVINPEGKNAMALIDPDVDGYNRSRNTQFQSTVDLTYDVPYLEGLSVIVTGAFDMNIANISFLQKSYDLYDYYTDQYNTTTGADTYSNDINLFQRTVGRGQANYEKTVGKHKLNLSGIVEFTGTRGDYLRGARTYTDFFTNDILDQASQTTASNSGRRNFGRLAAYIGRLNYDFSGKYLLELVGRYDGSYKYARAKRWVFFPSGSIGWRISEESFIKDNIAAISNLKLRFSYGESGSDYGDNNIFGYIRAYSANTARGYVFDDGALTVGMVAPGVVTDQLTWVTSKTSNLGLDVDVLRGKISGSFEVFERRNTGVLATRIQSVPNTFGASFPQENINSNLNHGFEITLSHRNKVGEIGYGISANFTYSRTKNLHNERAPFTSSWDQWRNSNENRYTGRMLMYEWDGRYTDIEQYETAPLLGGSAGNSKMVPGSYKLVDLNGDGIINSNDQSFDNWTFGANVNPPKQFGLTLEATYKILDINILLQGASGYTINYRNNDIWGYGRYPTLHEKFIDRWHPAVEGADPYDPSTQWTSGFYPALRNYNYENTTEANVIDIWRPNATYVRLKSVEIGVSLPKSIANKLRMESARIFVNGYNLLTFCNKLLKDADPERQEADWDAGLNYPLMKSYNVGLSVNF